MGTNNNYSHKCHPWIAHNCIRRGEGEIGISIIVHIRMSITVGLLPPAKNRKSPVPVQRRTRTTNVSVCPTVIYTDTHISVATRASRWPTEAVRTTSQATSTANNQHLTMRLHTHTTLTASKFLTQNCCEAPEPPLHLYIAVIIIQPCMHRAGNGWLHIHGTSISDHIHCGAHLHQHTHNLITNLQLVHCCIEVSKFISDPLSNIKA